MNKTLLKKGASLPRVKETCAYSCIGFRNFSECETFKGKKGGLTLWQS